MAFDVKRWVVGLEDVLGAPPEPTALFLKAFTHTSFAHEQPPPRPPDNERLEFLGDKVLGHVVAAALWEKFSDWSEGDLSRVYMALVKTETLASRSRAMKLGRWLRLGKGEEQSGGRDRDSNLCDVFEAVVGAMFVAQGMEGATRFVRRHLLEPFWEDVRTKQIGGDAKSRLQEWLHKYGPESPRYVVTGSTGPDHARVFSVDVTWRGRIIGSGRGPSKQAAEQAAAREALKQEHKGSDISFQ